MESIMLRSEFYYDLPEELIAQTPVEPRDSSRLMKIDRETGEITHDRFYNICDYLQNGDLLVMNDSRVFPARLYGTKRGTGAAVEFLLLKRLSLTNWETMVRPGKKLKAGAVVDFPEGLSAEVLETVEEGNRIVRFSFDGDFFDILDRIGQMPLPPYITERLEKKDRYNTIYCRETGSAAAPTAGLHFTDEVFAKLREKGVDTAYVTLHVGLGTFRPVKEDNILDHKMHVEHFSVPEETAKKIADCRARGGRVIAVGTTSCRTLESAAGMSENGEITACSADTGIFIYPGFKFKAIDGLITNFHLPESTLIMLVSAFMGKEKTMNAYKVAIEERYRFFSFGDSMMIV
ncbi:MAG: tRNA preQ1(34) S-adenosylmethionine ribosyltransferase-isomerase QueA [Ruminococcaceae bacterium]|nr:tRNA preQ1(34) S-adenosylmethionine ribosyltransferase-isomerase QueA [Oscillospiraceae bacterium]